MLSFTMTAEEQLLLELVNRARANPEAEATRFGIDLNADLAPGTISADAKQPLAPHQALTDAAQDYAQWMLDHDFFGHNTPPPDSTSPLSRARDAGYTGAVGENIAYQGRSSDHTAAERLELVYQQHEALFLSHGHRENLLYPSHRELGTGVRYGIFDSVDKGPLYAIMVAEEFGSRGGSEFFLTGVAYTDLVNANDFYDVGEGLGAVTVTATRSSDGAEYTTVTGDAGGYALQLPDGTYQVTASGGTLSSPLVLSHVVVNGRNEKVDFNTLTWTTVAIGGLVYADNDSNGIRRSDEAPLAGQTVFLDHNNNGSLDGNEPHIETDTNGSFLFTGLRRQAYRVVVQVPTGWQATGANGGVLDIDLGTGGSSLGHAVGLYSTNAKPVALADTFSFRQATVATIDVLANDVDPDGELTAAVVEVVVAPSRGIVAFDPATATVTYTPQPTYAGSDTFSYRVRDQRGAISDVAVVSLYVENDNTASFQNATNLFDVNGSGSVSPLDTMAVINEINTLGARRLPIIRNESPTTQHVDVNGDGFVSAIDALLVLVAISRSIAMREDIVTQQASIAAQTVTSDATVAASVASATSVSSAASVAAPTLEFTRAEDALSTTRTANEPSWERVARAARADAYFDSLIARRRTQSADDQKSEAALRP